MTLNGKVLKIEPPRPQSSTNQAEIVRQISKYSAQGIIEKSHSAHYSQVLLVPKPGGSKRMCIDYRSLNDCTVDAPGIFLTFKKC